MNLLFYVYFINFPSSCHEIDGIYICFFISLKPLYFAIIFGIARWEFIEHHRHISISTLTPLYLISSNTLFVNGSEYISKDFHL